MDNILDSVSVNVSSSKGMAMDGYDSYGDMDETSTSFSFDVNAMLSNWFFVGGVSGAVFLISVAIGLLLAKLKIKKGFDVYED